MNKRIKKAWDKLALYQKGLVIGFFIPAIPFILGFIGTNLFYSSDLKGCPASSPLMFLHFFFLPNKFLSILIIWPISGFISGLLFNC